MTWNRSDWERLATLFDGKPGPGWHESQPSICRLPYSGYRPEVREAPNGDTKPCPDCTYGRATAPHAAGGTDSWSCGTCRGSGRVPNVDAEGVCGVCEGGGFRKLLDGAPCLACSGTGRAPAKRWLHVADKYRDAPEWAREYHDRAYAQACRVADPLGVPAAFYPRPSVGALRVVDYPPGAGTVEHTDFDLFTIVLWRSTPEDLVRADAYEEGGMGVYPERLDTISPGLHIGELGELVGLGPATPHRVPARSYGQQSLLYFAIPDHAAILPKTQSARKCSNCRGSGIVASQVEYATDTCYCVGGFAPQNVGEWLAEREARSRVAAGGYK